MNSRRIIPKQNHNWLWFCFVITQSTISIQLLVHVLFGQLYFSPFLHLCSSARVSVRGCIFRIKRLKLCTLQCGEDTFFFFAKARPCLSARGWKNNNLEPPSSIQDSPRVVAKMSMSRTLNPRPGLHWQLESDQCQIRSTRSNVLRPCMVSSVIGVWVNIMHNLCEALWI